MTKQPIPVVPAAHYVCGGLAVNSWAETSVPGLFAAGECACTGLHGANRLASNSLLEALVFADRAAQRVAETGPARTATPAERRTMNEQRGTRNEERGTISEGVAAAVRKELRQLMWDCAGIVRTDAGLARAGARLAELACRSEGSLERLSPYCLETANLLTVARLIVSCARLRKESRGLHFNQDHPEKDDRYKKDTVVTLEDRLD